LGGLHHLQTIEPLDRHCRSEEVAVVMTTCEIYIRTVLDLYVRMPGAPQRICPHDRALAHEWFRRQIPLHVVESALLLGSGRRIYRRSDAPKLSPIRSMAYFGPILEQVVDQPPPATYIQYLRFKLGFDASFNTG
jgi:hypothetical protein